MAIVAISFAPIIASSSIQTKAYKIEKVKLVNEEDREESHYNLYPILITQIDDKRSLSSIPQGFFWFVTFAHIYTARLESSKIMSCNQYMVNCVRK